MIVNKKNLVTTRTKHAVIFIAAICLESCGTGTVAVDANLTQVSKSAEKKSMSPETESQSTEENPRIDEVSNPGVGTPMATNTNTQSLDTIVSLPCLQRPAASIQRVLQTPFEVQNPTAGTVFDARGIIFKAFASVLPFTVRRAADDVCVAGARVEGQMDRNTTWLTIKTEGIYDHDGINFPRATASFAVEGAWIDNVEDAIGPPKAPDTSRNVRWSIRNTYARYIRDDFVENDAALGGLIEDTLIDGTHAFISTRPGEGTTSSGVIFPAATVTVRDTLVRLDCKPDRRCDSQDHESASCPQTDSCGADKSLGMFFKWSAASANLKVDMRNTILRADDMGRNGASSMQFPDGVYENVTLIWLGPGTQYPAAVPPGVTVTKDINLWNSKRDAWLKRHGCDQNGDYCSLQSLDK